MKWEGLDPLLPALTMKESGCEPKEYGQPLEVGNCPSLTASKKAGTSVLQMQGNRFSPRASKKKYSHTEILILALWDSWLDFWPTEFLGNTFVLL